MARRAISLTGIAGIGVGLGALSASHWCEGPPASRSATYLRALPLNAIGLFAHYTASIPIPVLLRGAVYKYYCAIVGSDISETAGELTNFRSLSEFFCRSLRPEVRPIDHNAQLVCPCDGTVVAAGPVGAYGSIEVKNVNYRIRDLIGAAEREPLSQTSVAVSKREESGSRLWYTVIHMGSKDCHRFNSPASWRLTKRQHIDGYLLWLNPKVEDLYSQNERVALLGSWGHGFLSLIAVGAAGRGTVYLDVENESFSPSLIPNHCRISSEEYAEPKPLSVGETIGGFRLGSAIVLIFEAPDKGFKFSVEPGNSVRLGQQLASIAPVEKIEEKSALCTDTKRRNKSATSRGLYKRAW